LITGEPFVHPRRMLPGTPGGDANILIPLIFGNETGVFQNFSRSENAR